MFAVRLVHLGRPSLRLLPSGDARALSIPHPLGILLGSLLGSLFCCQALIAQTAQQRVYAAQPLTATSSVISSYNKDSQTGALGIISGSPFNERLEGGLLAIDGQGKFLFILNPQSNSISMFQIDASSGALSEVPASPFSAGPTINPNNAPSQPISIAAEPSGKYLYVGYASGNVLPSAAVTPFAIDAANLQLTLTPALSFDITGTPVQMLSDPKGLHLYVGLGPNAQSGQQLAGTSVYSIDAPTGALFLNGAAGGGSDTGRCIAIDPQGRFFFDGWGANEGFIDSGVISPIDGTSTPSSTLDLGVGDVPSILLVDSSGKFLYAGTTLGAVIYSLDQTTGQLTQLQGPLAGITLDKGHAVADPAGPFLYSLDSSGVHVFQIDSQSGSLTEISGSPFNAGSGGATGALGLAISAPSVQTVLGPVAQLFPASADLGQATVGQPSATRIISVANTGDQTLSLSGITITGPNAPDFSQASTCATPLAPNANCSISISFVPSVVGSETATLNIADNAPGSPQTAPLTGTGVAARSAVTSSPATLDFGAVALGGSVPAQTITITNSGTASLHVTGIALGGANPGDFSQSSTCAASPIAVQASCSISVSFSPQAEGQRSATITLTDDAPDSPQTLSVTGNVSSPFQLGPAASGSTSATISAGQTAQFSLQLSPGPGYTGTVSFACAGAPQAATCSVTPASVAVTGSSPVAFSVSVTTKGLAALFPLNQAPKIPPLLSLRVFLLALPCFFAALRLRSLAKQNFAPRAQVHVFAHTVVFTMFLLFASGFFSGCGGGTTAAITSQTPAPVVTPSGTTTLTVTATAGNLPPQTITLTLTVR
jgi:6-phosphogluconolactonase (cycloisomerase 2 family)